MEPARFWILKDLNKQIGPLPIELAYAPITYPVAADGRKTAVMTANIARYICMIELDCETKKVSDVSFEVNPARAWEFYDFRGDLQRVLA